MRSLLQQWLRHVPDGTATCGQTPLLRKAANVIEELSAKYEKALRDLVKEVELPKEGE